MSHWYSILTDDLEDGALVACGNCSWRGVADDLDAVKNLDLRINPGETVPAGECPECGALAYLVKSEPERAESGAFNDLEKLAALDTEKFTTNDEEYDALAAAIETASACLPAIKLYRRLADGLSDMVEGGRLREGDIPDDYQWLVTTLVRIAGSDPADAPKPEPKPLRVVVTIEGGNVQSVEVPAGVVVEVHDYDNAEDERATEDAEGDRRTVETWEHEGAPTVAEPASTEGAA